MTRQPAHVRCAARSRAAHPRAIRLHTARCSPLHHARPCAPDTATATTWQRMAWAPKVGDHLLVSCDAFKNKGSTVVKIMGPADDMTILVSWDDESEHMNQWIEFDPNLIKAGPDTALALCAPRRSAAPPPRRPAAQLPSSAAPRPKRAATMLATGTRLQAPARLSHRSWGAGTSPPNEIGRPLRIALSM